MYSLYSIRLLTKRLASAQTRHFVSQDKVQVIKKPWEMKEYVPIATLVISAVGLAGVSAAGVNYSINRAVGPFSNKLDRIEVQVNKLGDQVSYIMDYLKIPTKVEQVPIKEEPKKKEWLNGSIKIF